MAKPHRMFLLIFAAAAGLFTIHSGHYHWVFLIALVVMNVLLIVTLANRLRLIARPVDNSKEEGK